jgi:hypothetical protein
LLGGILADVDYELAGRAQPDDVTLVTATVIRPMNREPV